MGALLLCAATAQAATDADDLRVLGGKVVNIRQLNSSGLDNIRAQGFDAIVGKVIQVAKGGVLVSTATGGTREPYTTVFVMDLDGFADGDRFGLLAKEAGVMEYTTVLGAKKTVRQFSPPYKPTADQIAKFHNLERMEELATKDREAKNAKAAAELATQQAAQDAANRKLREDKAQAEKDAKAFAIDAKVLAFHRRNAERGDAEAQYQLGVRLLAGKGAAVDEVEGRKWLAAAAAQGHAKAAAMAKNQP